MSDTADPSLTLFQIDWNRHSAAQWQTMQDLYKVDLDSFVGLDADMTLSSFPSEGGYPAGDSGHEEEPYDDEPGEAEDEWGE